MNDTASIVSKVWSFCHTLRDDGVSYGDYLEQLTYLLFLKMADEYAKIYKKEVGIPDAYNWDSLKTRKGADLESHYITLLRTLEQQKGMIGQIFVKSQNQIQDPAKLYKIIHLIDAENWVMMAADVKANVIFFDNQPAAKHPWTQEVWFYDFRTNIHFTKKKNLMAYDDLKDFIDCYSPQNRHKRKETWSEDTPDGRWRKFTCDEIMARDKTSLDIFWIRDQSLADLDNLPDPDVLAEEIVENLEAGVESFRQIMDRSMDDKAYT